MLTFNKYTKAKKVRTSDHEAEAEEHGDPADLLVTRETVALVLEQNVADREQTHHALRALCVVCGQQSRWQVCCVSATYQEADGIHAGQRLNGTVDDDEQRRGDAEEACEYNII